MEKPILASPPPTRPCSRLHFKGACIRLSSELLDARLQKYRYLDYFQLQEADSLKDALLTLLQLIIGVIVGLCGVGLLNGDNS